MTLIENNQTQDLRITCLDSARLDEIHQIYVQAYLYLGLSVSAFSGEELARKYDGIMSYEDAAFFVYLDTPFGRKISLLFSRPSPAAKRLLVQKYLELIQQKPWYIEASARIEQISSETNIPYISEQEVVERILQKKVSWIGQGYYQRELSKTGWVTKRIYGNPQTIEISEALPPSYS